MMERAKEPCVIEILDDNDDGDENSIGYNSGSHQNLDQKPKAKRKADQQPNTRAPSIHPKSKGTDQKKLKTEIIDLTATTSAATIGPPSAKADKGVALNPLETWV